MKANSNLAKSVTTQSCNQSNKLYHEKYLYQSCNDNTIPFGYQNSDLKNMYLTREALNAKYTGPNMNQEQLLIQRSAKI